MANKSGKRHEPSQRPARVMVFEVEWTGHHPEYIQSLLTVPETYCESTSDIVFCVHPNLADRIPEGAFAHARERLGIKIEMFGAEEMGRIESTKSPLLRSFEAGKLLCRYARRLRIDHCMIMSLNHLQVPLALIPRRYLSWSYSGILFGPFTRMQIEGNRLRKAISRLHTWRKRLLLRQMIKSEHLKTVFILNDLDSVLTLNRSLGTQKTFQVLPDPIPKPEVKEQFIGNLRERYDLGNRKIVLLIGTVSYRRGVDIAIESLLHIPRPDLEDLALLVIGEKDGDLGPMYAMASRVSTEQPTAKFIVEERHLSSAEFSGFLSNCDCVLMPYRLPGSSSGILGHAALAGKPVIGPASGLIGELIRQYDLGVSTDLSTPAMTAEAISEFLRKRGSLGNTNGMQRYVAERSIEEFQRIIFQDFPVSTNAARIGI